MSVKEWDLLKCTFTGGVPPAGLSVPLLKGIQHIIRRIAKRSWKYFSKAAPFLFTLYPMNEELLSLAVGYRNEVHT